MGVGGQRHAPTALSPGLTRYPLCKQLVKMHIVINLSRYEASENREGADYKESNVITSYSPFCAL